MMYRTHKAGGALAGMVLFTYMQRHGMVTTEVSPLVQMLIMYPGVSWGSTAPDLDHHWEAVKEKTPFNMLVHKVLHRSQPSHRSWQTHSILVTGGFLSMLWALVVYGGNWFGGFNSVDWMVLRLMLLGVIVGAASHLLYDLFTVAGIWLYPGVKIRLVPGSSFFATDSTWEHIIYYISIFATFVLFAGVVSHFAGYDMWAMIGKGILQIRAAM